MRVTNKMLSNNFLTDMSANLRNMQKLQLQLSSGKEFRKPSDNPFAVARSMQLNSQISANKQYNSNIKDTMNWLDTTDTALGQIGNVIQGIREKLVSAGNAAYGDDERQKIKDEINQRVSQISQILNTNFDGEYIFGGTRGTTKPVEIKNDGTNTVLIYNSKAGTELATTSTEFSTINSKRAIEISQGVTVDYNVNAVDVISFKDKSGNVCDLRDILESIVTDLGDSTKVDNLTTTDLASIDSAMSNLLKVRSDVGAKENRLDSAREQNEQANQDMTEVLSKTEDIDITEKTMEYSTMQTVYLAALQTSAKVIQPTLMDYMR